MITKEIFHYGNATGLVLKLQDIGKIRLYGFQKNQKFLK